MSTDYCTKTSGMDVCQATKGHLGPCNFHGQPDDILCQRCTAWHHRHSGCPDPSRRTELLATMAATVAAAFVGNSATVAHDGVGPTMDENAWRDDIAETAVDIAERILNLVEKR